MATSVVEYEEGVNKRLLERLLRDMRSDIEVGWFHIAVRRARMILQIDPGHKEAKECLEHAEAALAAQKKTQSVEGGP